MDVTTAKRMSGIEKTLIRQINDLADASCINLGLGELRFPTPRPILDHVRECSPDWKLGYTPNEGLPRLRELIASRAGFTAAPEQVCVTVGAQEAIFASLMVLVDDGDEILIPDPGFPAYESIVRMSGGVPVRYPLPPGDGFRPDMEKLEQLISARTRVLVINSPHNPTGAVLGKEEIRRLVTLCEERGILILSDEVYEGIVFEGRAESPARYTGRCIVVGSMSKTYAMTGWRLGWAVAPPMLVKPLAAFHQLSVTCTPAISQYASIFALEGGAEAERMANVDELARRRRLMMDCLERDAGLRFVSPAGAFYVMADISGRMARFGNSMEAAIQLLAAEKVVTIPGSAFGHLGEGHLRLSFAAPPGEIEEGVKRLGRFLAR